MQDINDKLIVALDVDKLEIAKDLIEDLYPTVKLFKVGSQLFTACGPEAIRMVGEKGGEVFLDLKFHDIPHTVYKAVASGLGPHVFMMTLHTLGGLEMLREGIRGAEDETAKQQIKKPILVGVTVLTSEAVTPEEVLKRALLAKQAGLDGVVCAVSEARLIREKFGREFIIVTPGIRPKGTRTDDQKRVATAQEAIDAGADFIVVGRPILEAKEEGKDPLKALQEILGE
ncbi:MAG: hypothetical protein AMJ95_07540 [Omnitrophica WOR_2 bacterium SM23_72]|nr:MAG: hypothetical protein AMJ95_07540 [Omnitrophica WOR_2 bacterium SM23_72]